MSGSQDENFVDVSLDSTLDDIETLPGFSTWPTGVYHVGVDDGFEEKDVNGKKAMTLNVRLMTVEQIVRENLEAGEEEPKPGDITGFMWMMQNKFGASSMKDFMKPIGENMGTTRLREIVENSKGIELMLVIARRRDRKDKETWRMQAKRVVVV